MDKWRAVVVRAELNVPVQEDVLQWHWKNPMLLSVFRLMCYTPNFGQSRRKTAIFRDYCSVPLTIDSISIMEAVIPAYSKKSAFKSKADSHQPGLVQLNQTLERLTLGCEQNKWSVWKGSWRGSSLVSMLFAPITEISCVRLEEKLGSCGKTKLVEGDETQTYDKYRCLLSVCSLIRASHPSPSPRCRWPLKKCMCN